MLNLFDTLFLRKPKNPKIKPVVLICLDGWGIAPQSSGNAITQAKTPHMDSYPKSYPHTQLIASGESVGLPANQVGNSEVGHLTIGAGRVIDQTLTRISKSIIEGEFLQNKAVLDVIHHIKKNSSKLHILGIAGSGNVHGSVAHLEGIIDLCRRQMVTDVSLHLFTDGRDSPPQEAIEIISTIQNKIDALGIGRVASLCGRYYAMDRDGRWMRTQRAYELLFEGKGDRFVSVTEAIEASYKKGLTDEFLEPIVILDQNKEPSCIGPNDGVIFYNFRSDRAKQLTMAITLPDFENLKKIEVQDDFKHGKTAKTVIAGPTFTRNKKPQGLFVVTMTQYQKDLPVSAVAFPIETVTSTLAEIFSKSNYRQLHLAESEKETMVTYYFDGMREVPFVGEEKIIIPSLKVPLYDKKPEMSAKKIVETFKKNLFKDVYHFFVINFANPDMVAHTGNLEATKKALAHTDSAVGEIVSQTLSLGGAVFITADHGNAEELLTFPDSSFYFTTDTGKVNTDHSNNPVPFYCIATKLIGGKKLAAGTLSDVAPTILSYMNLTIPPVMTGKNLLQ